MGARQLLLLSPAVLSRARPRYFCYSRGGRCAAAASRSNYFLLSMEEALTLKAQVEAVSGAALARALPAACYSKWLLFASAPAPVLVFIPDNSVYQGKPRGEAQEEVFARLHCGLQGASG